MNGLSHKIFLLDIAEFLLVLERRQVLMERMFGVFLEFINLKK
jgi:hypothetical protein